MEAGSPLQMDPGTSGHKEKFWLVCDVEPSACGGFQGCLRLS